MALVVAMGTLVGCGGASTPPAEVETGDQAEFADIRQSCDVFTLDMARQILGDSAMRSEISAPFTGSSEDLAGSTCTYEAEDPTPANQFLTTITATLTLNGAKTETGRSSNRFTFEQNKASFEEAGAPVETLTGLGDAAYYIGDVINQVHVLLNGGTYAVIASADAPDGDRRSASEQLAKIALQGL
jgi:hypothetical protein